MTDQRLGDALWEILERIPRGAGVVFRDYALAPAERRLRFERIRRVAKRRGFMLVRAGSLPMRGEDGIHGRHRRTRPGIRTAAAHSRREAIAAIRAGADMLFVSPVYATRSHPVAPRLGRVRLGLMIRGLRVPIVALGGMDARRLRGMQALGITRFAAIDAWLPGRRPGGQTP
ncbi:thiamine phosphate synthase [Sphingomonas japonica]|uniref:Thiamine-phosphate pyrophosphorylase n=1 Tax=Sphingomonas japonica TaxID=511662 RepID=A0ABX0U297_9SPHN|nr:thiamine phosphate synthase [Sphingomonas japonica]NIJ23497.1 thiamine-phosphate pyrophosphorylase [Sphingomonas japonica]